MAEVWRHLLYIRGQVPWGLPVCGRGPGEPPVCGRPPEGPPVRDRGQEAPPVHTWPSFGGPPQIDRGQVEPPIRCRGLGVPPVRGRGPGGTSQAHTHGGINMEWPRGVNCIKDGWRAYIVYITSGRRTVRLGSQLGL